MATPEGQTAGTEAAAGAEPQSIHDAVAAGLDDADLGYEELNEADKQLLEEEGAAAPAAAAEGAKEPDPEAKPDPAAQQTQAPDPAKPDPAKPADPAKPPETPLDKLAKEPEKPGKLTEEDLALPEAYKAHDKGKLAERWGKLRGGYQAQTQRADTAEARVGELSPYVERLATIDQVMEQAKATPEQTVEAVQYLAAINSGTPQGLQSARAMLAAQLEQIDIALGTTGPGSPDLVGKYPDLVDAVTKGEITEGHAEELAIARGRTAQRDGQLGELARVMEGRQAQETLAEAVATAQGDLATLDSYLTKTDPDYARFRPALVQSAEQMQRSGVEPEQWIPLLVQQYRGAKGIAAAGPMPASPNGQGGLQHQQPPQQRVPQFQRPGQSVADGGPSPASAKDIYEATDMALAARGLS